MPGGDKKPCWMRPNSLVLLVGELDALKASRIPALAQIGGSSRPDAHHAAPDQLVSGPEDRFVCRQTSVSLIHCGRPGSRRALPSISMTAGATVLQAAVLPDGQLEAAAEPVRRG